MAGKAFTEEQKNLLSKNPNVESVEATRIIYTEAFKIYYVKNYLLGKKPTEIFIEAGFDPAILGNKRIERASARWRKLYADGSLKIEEIKQPVKTVKNNKNNKATKVVKMAKTTTKEVAKENIQENNEQVVKRRGRPRKKELVENIVPAKEKIEEIVKIQEQPKKRRGRPRKNAVETITVVDTVKQKKVKKVPRKRVNKIAALAQNIKLPETVEKVKSQDTVQGENKRRGRPRKNVEEITKVVELAPKVIEEKSAPPQQPKKKRGRPRKQNMDMVLDTPPLRVYPIEEEKEVVKVVETKEKPQEIEQKTIIEKAQQVEQNPIVDLVKAINKLTREVNSLKRLVAGKKRINY